MSDLPCPDEWEYEDAPDHVRILRERTLYLLRSVRSASMADKLRHARDTRNIHGRYFKDLTPQGFPYFAGHYRGEGHRCLNNYEVGIQGDPRVGHTAATVPMEMDKFSEDMRSQLALVEHHLGAPQRIFSASDKLVSYIRFVAALFVYFLEIHPYANGNGHIARTIVLLLLGRNNIYPRQAWTIEPKPADPPYTNLISRYRSGDQDPLVQFIVKAI